TRGGSRHRMPARTGPPPLRPTGPAGRPGGTAPPDHLARAPSAPRGRIPMTGHRPWRGVLVATALPLRDDLNVDIVRYAEPCSWLVANGCDGVVPNGSLGEYQMLTPEERARVVETAVAAVGGERVMPGVAAYGTAEARRWAEQAAEAGCRAVMLLPPNA